MTAATPGQVVWIKGWIEQQSPIFIKTLRLYELRALGAYARYRHTSIYDEFRNEFDWLRMDARQVVKFYLLGALHADHYSAFTPGQIDTYLDDMEGDV